MSFEYHLKEIIKARLDDEKSEQARIAALRDAWAKTKREVICPVLEQAVNAFKANAVTATKTCKDGTVILSARQQDLQFSFDEHDQQVHCSSGAKAVQQETFSVYTLEATNVEHKVKEFVASIISPPAPQAPTRVVHAPLFGK